MTRALVIACLMLACDGRLNDVADRAIDEASVECAVLVDRAEDDLRKYCAEIWLVLFEYMDRWQASLHASVEASCR